jgi:signal transduction histidine kinase/CheY-like chemotaxis protein
MKYEKYKKYPLVYFLLTRLITFLAKRVSFTFAVSVFSVIGAWFAVFFAIMLVTSFHHFSPELVKTGTLIAVITTSFTTLLHFTHFGIFSRLGYHGFTSVPRTINKTLKRGVDPSTIRELDDASFTNFATAYFKLPRENTFYALIYAVFVGLVLAAYIAIKTSDLGSTLYILAGAGLAVGIYTQYTFLMTDFLIGPLRAKIHEEIGNRGVSVDQPKTLSLNFSFFLLVVLSSITVILTALYVRANYENLSTILLFTGMATVLVAITVYIHYLAVDVFLNEIHYSTGRMVKGSKGFLYPSFDFREIRNSTQNYNHVTQELLELRHDLESRIQARTIDILKAKEIAEAANQAKSSFLANMSHEIRTPMNGIIGMTEIMIKSNLPDEQKEYLGIIENSANTLLAIINDILDFSKIEANKLELEYVPFNLTKILEDVADTEAIKANKKNINLVTDLDNRIPPSVIGDPLRLRQVLLNLVNNAIKFTDKGEILISCSLTEQTRNHFLFLFKVSDTGIGISEEQRQRLFQSFSQVDNTITRRFGGTGLGLVISKKLVEMMNGTIDVESQPGKGSTFYFSARFRQDPAYPEIQKVDSGELRGLRILIIDDNETNLEIFNKYLEFCQCRSVETTSAEEGLKILREAEEKNEKFDAVLVDCQMPVMDGITFSRLVKKDPKIRSNKLIMLSSIADIFMSQEINKTGFVGYLNKPVKIQDLKDVIVKAIHSAENNEPVPQEPPKPTAAVTTPGPVNENIEILLVEDNKINQRIAQLNLEKLGYRTEVAENGEEAISKFLSNNYALIFMDVQMPVMDGLEATTRIRHAEEQSGNQQRVPIIAMTANAMKGDREICLAAGMDDYISKPFRSDELLDILNKWLPKG